MIFYLQRISNISYCKFRFHVRNIILVFVFLYLHLEKCFFLVEESIAEEVDLERSCTIPLVESCHVLRRESGVKVPVCRSTYWY